MCSAIPLAPLVGGFVAGRAAGSDRLARRGMALGALAGLTAAPALRVVVVSMWLLVVGRAGGPPPAHVPLLECLGLAVAATVYAVGGSTAGGLLGAIRADRRKAIT